MRDRLSANSQVASSCALLPELVVLIDGPGALAEFLGQEAHGRGKPVIVSFLGDTSAQVPQRYRDAFPQEHLSLHVPQYLAQAAFADLMQPYLSKARRSGDPVTAYHPANTGHISIINPTLPHGQRPVALINDALWNLSK